MSEGNDAVPLPNEKGVFDALETHKYLMNNLRQKILAPSRKQRELGAKFETPENKIQWQNRMIERAIYNFMSRVGLKEIHIKDFDKTFQCVADEIQLITEKDAAETKSAAADVFDVLSKVTNAARMQALRKELDGLTKLMPVVRYETPEARKETSDEHTERQNDVIREALLDLLDTNDSESFLTVDTERKFAAIRKKLSEMNAKITPRASGSSFITPFYIR